ncbi:hypothetical protein [uncultured Jatrophihabitans sp.]|uniref:hypothetical protein n=1 Tax=uncultured Jatrophihabitans sp. TaxID=1610747 RepID=UPI0035CC486F
MGGGGPVGGNPASISDGASGLGRAARVVGSTAAAINSAGSQGSGAAGGDPMSGAISRLAAAFSQTASDVEIELQAASKLAGNAAQDLTTAGGGAPGHGPLPVGSGGSGYPR